MRRLYLLLSVFGLLVHTNSTAFDIGLIPLHDHSHQVELPYGRNISLHGTPGQIENLRKWIAGITSVPKGLETLIGIQNSGHKLFIYHSKNSTISSGRTSAPMSQNLINGKGESVDILFNANIPDSGSHQVYANRKVPIEYTAEQNLFHELAHALHMMKGTWMYFKSEHQAIMEENLFRKQLAESEQKPFKERVYVSGLPVCPQDHLRVDTTWGQELICPQ